MTICRCLRPLTVSFNSVFQLSPGVYGVLWTLWTLKVRVIRGTIKWTYEISGLLMWLICSNSKYLLNRFFIDLLLCEVFLLKFIVLSVLYLFMFVIWCCLILLLFFVFAFFVLTFCDVSPSCLKGVLNNIQPQKCDIPSCPFHCIQVRTLLLLESCAPSSCCQFVH